MISGVHAIIYSKQAERLRDFFQDVLKLRAVDAGRGWLIFALPSTEVAMHPDDESRHELFLMCDDVYAATAELTDKRGGALNADLGSRLGTGHPSEAAQRR
jgi:hypothetical protein